jgi:hypothetical protein
LTADLFDIANSFRCQEERSLLTELLTAGPEFCPKNLSERHPQSPFLPIREGQGGRRQDGFTAGF